MQVTLPGMPLHEKSGWPTAAQPDSTSVATAPTSPLTVDFIAFLRDRSPRATMAHLYDPTRPRRPASATALFRRAAPRRGPARARADRIRHPPWPRSSAGGPPDRPPATLRRDSTSTRPLRSRAHRSPSCPEARLETGTL